MKRIERRVRNAGFTMLELLIALGVVAILGAIAYPSFRQTIVNGRRADATTALVHLANRMEQYHAQNNTYATATIATGTVATDVLTSSASKQGYYTVSITQQDATTYTILATRAGAQTVDTLCGNFQLTSAGTKTVTGTLPVTRCW